MNGLRPRGQSVLEYAIALAVVMAALLTMQRVVRDAVMGRWRSVADQFGYGMQYEPGITRQE